MRCSRRFGRTAAASWSNASGRGIRERIEGTHKERWAIRQQAGMVGIAYHAVSLPTARLSRSSQPSSRVSATLDLGNGVGNQCLTLHRIQQVNGTYPTQGGQWLVQPTLHPPGRVETLRVAGNIHDVLNLADETGDASDAVAIRRWMPILVFDTAVHGGHGDAPLLQMMVLDGLPTKLTTKPEPLVIILGSAVVSLSAADRDDMGVATTARWRWKARTHLMRASAPEQRSPHPATTGNANWRPPK